MPVLEIAKYLGKVKNRVNRCGVELEGAWLKLPPGVLRLEPDGSVLRAKRPPGCITGELPIGPVIPIGLPDLITRCYPNMVDESCGMHVHMSFETLRYYGLLMTRDYQDTMVNQLDAWATEAALPRKHPIWARLQGKSEFCKDEFFPEGQVTNKRKDYDHFRQGNRYTIIHYCGRLMTIECRVLPMMDTAELAVRAAMRVIEITNACLYVLGNKRERRIEEKLELPNGHVYEESLQENL